MASTALRLAAQVFARKMRELAVSTMRSYRTAAAVNVVKIEDNIYDVNAGRPVNYGETDHGPWGWYPINAYMFETHSKHPLFGNEAVQYHQPYRPILDKTAELGIDQAEAAYAGQRIRELGAEFGYK